VGKNSPIVLSRFWTKVRQIWGARILLALAGSRSGRRLYTPLQMGGELHRGIRN